VEVEQKPIEGNYTEIFKSLVTFNPDLFDAEELAVMAQVVQEFQHVTAKNLIEMSHQEKSWLENEREKQLISYQKYAFDLVDIEYYNRIVAKLIFNIFRLRLIFY